MRHIVINSSKLCGEHKNTKVHDENKSKLTSMISEVQKIVLINTIERKITNLSLRSGINNTSRSKTRKINTGIKKVRKVGAMSSNMVTK